MTSKHEFSTTPLRATEPAVGFEVVTVDGMPVGKVSEIAGGFMRIEAHLRPDFWLRLDDAAQVEGRGITLAYPKEALHQHRHPGPATTAEDFLPVGADPVLLDAAEQLAQREAMEHQLEEQRRRLARRASAVSTTAEWEREQRAGARIASIVMISVAVVTLVATALVLRGIRRRRRIKRSAVSNQPTVLGR